MHLTDVDLAEVVEAVWTAMLGYELVALDPAGHPSAVADQPGKHFVGCVQVTGGWDVALIVAVPEALGRDVASRMFGRDDDALSDDEVRDALGELANMIGGNVKGLVTGDSQLSLPTVSEGLDCNVAVPGGGVVSTLDYRCGAWSLRVQLIEREQ